jgi:hypothetical protein
MFKSGDKDWFKKKEDMGNASNKEKGTLEFYEELELKSKKSKGKNLEKFQELIKMANDIQEKESRLQRKRAIFQSSQTTPPDPNQTQKKTFDIVLNKSDQKVVKKIKAKKLSIKILYELTEKVFYGDMENGGERDYELFWDSQMKYLIEEEDEFTKANFENAGRGAFLVVFVKEYEILDFEIETFLELMASEVVRKFFVKRFVRCGVDLGMVDWEKDVLRDRLLLAFRRGFENLLS